MSENIFNTPPPYDFDGDNREEQFVLSPEAQEALAVLLDEIPSGRMMEFCVEDSLHINRLTGKPITGKLILFRPETAMQINIRLE
jgi:hypothetical protein